MSLDRVEALTYKAISTSVVFKRILEAYEKDNNKKVICIEGKDDVSYYLSAIRQKMDWREVILEKCSGKQIVLGLHNQITNHPILSSSISMYFVDRDYDHILHEAIYPNEVFVSEYNSLESYYISFDSIAIMVQEKFNFKKSPPDIEYLQLLFEKANSEFCTNMKDHIILILSLWDYNKNIKLRDLSFSGRFSIKSDGSLEFKDPSTTLEDILRSNRDIEYNEKQIRGIAEKISNTIKDMHPKMYIRGKFYFEFLLIFITWLQKRMIDGDLKGEHECLTRETITRNNLMEFLGSRIKVSKRIHDYINRRLN